MTTMTTTHGTDADASNPVSQKQVMGAVAASTLGWALDLFDLFTLLYVAPVVARLFFPSSHEMLSLAATYASFAVTLLMRPFGSALFGSYADRRGRKGAMIVAVVGVGVATAAFGLLPTVAQVGVLAPILFLVLRLVQGVFVGGVVASTHTIGTESVAPRYRGAVSGLIGGGGAGLGALLASLAYLAMAAIFPGAAFDVWGWRCMFFLGILSSVLGLFIFSSLEESPLWKQAAQAKADKVAAAKLASRGTIAIVKSPLKTLFSAEHRNILLVNLLLTIAAGSGYYLTSGFLPAFLNKVTRTPNSDAALILMIASVAVVISCVAVGHLSTLIGRKRTFILIGIVQLVARPALYLWLPQAGSFFVIGAEVVLLSMLGSMGYAPLLIFLNERFPTAIRASGTGLSWNIGFAIGGMMPTFVSLVAKTPAELPGTLAWFVGVISVLFMIGAAVIPETIGALDRAPRRLERGRGALSIANLASAVKRRLPGEPPRMRDRRRRRTSTLAIDYGVFVRALPAVTVDRCVAALKARPVVPYSLWPTNLFPLKSDATRGNWLDPPDRHVAGQKQVETDWRPENLKAMEQRLAEVPDGQVSLTDADARSIVTSGHGTGVVVYNVQTAVDHKHHLIVAHEVTNVGNDRRGSESGGRPSTGSNRHRRSHRHRRSWLLQR